MPKAAPIITNFTAGEFSPLMAGRVDVKYYPNACRKMRNFVALQQGPARRRAGTRFVSEVKDSADRTWLWRFEFNVEQAYVLEFGDQYIRFYANHGVVESAPATPLEVATPYTAADLITDIGTFALSFVQSGDILYICHPDFAPRKLSRTGPAAFSLSTLEPRGGPFQDIDPDETITVYASASTGTAQTLTASSAIFDAAHVGSLFYLEQRNTDNIAMWEVGKAVAINAVRRSDGKNYQAVAAGTTGGIRPVHTVGSKFDGDPGVQWTFLDAGYGWCVITAIGGGGTTATVDILSRIPNGAVAVANASTRWAFGYWSDFEGWPHHVTFHKERLTFARDQLIWHSVAGDFEDFRDKDTGGLVTDEMAITSDITSDKVNQIEWLAPHDVALLVGTAGDESAISEITTSDPLGPGNVQARKQLEHGSRHVAPVRVDDAVLFAQRAGRKIRAMMFSWQKEGYTATDLTILAEHITRSGLIAMAYQQEPQSIVWGARDDGALIGLTLNQGQEEKAWHPHRVGGYSDADHVEYAVVESLITIPAPGQDRDELWMIVRRRIDGADVRYVEFMEKDHEEGSDPEDAFYVDCGLTLDNVKSVTLTPGAGATVKGTTGVVFTGGAAVFAAGDVGKFIHYRYYRYNTAGKRIWATAVAEITQFNSNTEVEGTILAEWPTLSVIPADGWRMTVTTISGLDHLEGETIQLWTDGASHPDVVVTAGSVTLQEPASKVHAGFGATAVLQPMPIEAGAADGTAQGKTQRISRCIIRFHETAGARFGKDEDKTLDRVELRGGGDPMDAAVPLFTGDKVVAWPDGYDGPALITIVQDTPGPCTIVALMPQITTQDNR